MIPLKVEGVSETTDLQKVDKHKKGTGIRRKDKNNFSWIYRKAFEWNKKIYVTGNNANVDWYKKLFFLVKNEEKKEREVIEKDKI